MIFSIQLDFKTHFIRGILQENNLKIKNYRITKIQMNLKNEVG